MPLPWKSSELPSAPKETQLPKDVAIGYTVEQEGPRRSEQVDTLLPPLLKLQKVESDFVEAAGDSPDPFESILEQYTTLARPSIEKSLAVRQVLDDWELQKDPFGSPRKFTGKQTELAGGPRPKSDVKEEKPESSIPVRNAIYHQLQAAQPQKTSQISLHMDSQPRIDLPIHSMSTRKSSFETDVIANMDTDRPKDGAQSTRNLSQTIVDDRQLTKKPFPRPRAGF